MSLDLIFNELCCQSQVETVPEAREVMGQFLDTLRFLHQRAGDVRFRTKRNFRSELIAPGYSIGRWLDDREVDREQRRRLRSFSNRSPLLDSSDSPELIGRFEDLGIEASWEGLRADGLLAALLLNGIAISALTDDHWDRSSVEFLVTDLVERATSTELVNRRQVVPHASTSDNARAHLSWLMQRDPVLGHFRSRVHIAGASHIEASGYSQGKHMCGRTNEARKRSAISTGNGQFIASHNGESVGDKDIHDWELSGLKAAWGGKAEVKEHGSGTFYIYHRLAHTIGYVCKSGQTTCTIRIEWSSGTVHSHPRGPSKAGM